MVKLESIKTSYKVKPLVASSNYVRLVKGLTLASV